MTRNLSSKSEPNILLADTREFWREVGKEMVTDSIKLLDSTAQNLISTVGIIVGLYLNAIVFSQISLSNQDIFSLIIFSFPVLFLLISLLMAIMLLLPKQYKLNIHSSEASRLIFDRSLRRKLRLLRVSFLFLIFAIINIFLAIILYIQR